jgi:hypothetical protein
MKKLIIILLLISIINGCSNKPSITDNKNDKELFYIEYPEEKESIVYIHLIPTLNKCEFISQSIFTGETDVNQEYDDFEYSIKKDNLILRSNTINLYDMNLKIKDNELLRTKNDNGYKIIKYKLVDMKTINTKIKALDKISANLKAESIKKQSEINKIAALNDIKVKLNNNFETLKPKVEALNNRNFSLDKINKELSKVKEQYNKWLITSQDNKDYQKTNIDYAITNVEYQYNINITLYVNNTKKQINDICKIVSTINKLLDQYKSINGTSFINNNLAKLVNNANDSIRDIDIKADQYFEDGKDILNEAYKYK